MNRKRPRNSSPIFFSDDDDFIEMNDCNFKELHISNFEENDCLLPKEHHFRNILDAVEYLEVNKTNSYLLCRCGMKGKE